MLDTEDRRTRRMLPKSSSQKTLRAAMQEERASMASRLLSPPGPDDAASVVSNPSFRVYYGVASAGSVPFLWESAPGTPKNGAVSDTKLLPPLTPPPSYYNNKAAAKNRSRFVKSQSSKKLLPSYKPASSFVQSIIPKQLRRSHTMPSRSPSSSSSAPPSSKDAVQCGRRNSRLLASPRSSFSSTSRGDDEEEGGSSPTSTLCFRARHSSSSGAGGRMHGLLASVMGG